MVREHQLTGPILEGHGLLTGDCRRSSAPPRTLDSSPVRILSLPLLLVMFGLLLSSLEFGQFLLNGRSIILIPRLVGDLLERVPLIVELFGAAVLTVVSHMVDIQYSILYHNTKCPSLRSMSDLVLKLKVSSYFL